MNLENCDQHDVRQNITDSRHWLRLGYMLVFILLLQVAALVMWVLCALQFLSTLLTGADLRNLRELGSSIATFIHQSLDFLSFNTDIKPFPFSAWPGAVTDKQGGATGQADSTQVAPQGPASAGTPEQPAD